MWDRNYIITILIFFFLNDIKKSDLDYIIDNTYIYISILIACVSQEIHCTEILWHVIIFFFSFVIYLFQVIDI